MNSLEMTEKRSESTVPFNEALEKCGFGIFHIKTTLLGFLILLYVLNEIMGMGFIMPAAQCDLDLSDSDKGWASAMSPLGLVFSSHFWGYISDTRGRKFVILIGIFFAVLTSNLMAFTSNFYLILFLRFMVGFFIAGPSTSSYPFIGEFFTDKNRAVIITWISVSVGVSAIYSPGLSWWALSYDWSFHIGGLLFRPWRILPLIYSMPGIVTFFWLLYYPETPKFLLTMDKNDEALEILKHIYKVNNRKKSADDYPVKSLKPEINEQYLLLKTCKGITPVIQSIWNQTVPLMKPPHLRYFAACCFLHFSTLGIASGVGIWYAELMNRVMTSDSLEEISFCDIISTKIEWVPLNATSTVFEKCSDYIDPNVWIVSMILGAIYTTFFLLMGFTIKTTGRRVILVVSLFSSGISGIVLIYVTNPIWIVVLFITFLSGCMINVSTINGAAVIVFPAFIRAMSICISMLCGRIGGFLATNFIGYFLSYSCSATFYSFSTIALIAGCISFILPN